MASFNKLYYMTLSGEKKLNAVTIYVNKEVLATSGLDTDLPITIKAEKGKIIIEQEAGYANSNI